MTISKEYLKGLPVIGKVLHVAHNQVVQIQLIGERYPVYRAETKKAMEYLAGKKPQDKRVFFCAVPIHNNLGDQAQASCIRNWVGEHYPDCELVELPAWPFYNNKFRKLFKSLVNKNNLIIIQSGYCTTEGHYNHKVHRYLVKSFPQNPIVIMPQTVNFHKRKEAYKTGKIYKEHPRLLFLSRDRKSDQYAHEFFGNTNIRLCPDIVTSQIGTMYWDLPREGVLICVRNDGEKLYTDQQIKELSGKFEEAFLKTSIIDTNYPSNIRDFKEAFPSCYHEKLCQFASARVVITDRYHGTIFAMITNTPVIVLATRDHKVKTGTEWFAGIYDGSYYNVGNLESAYQKAMEILKQEIVLQNDAYFKREYYDKLPNIIEKL